jgi:hypothetical protein
MLFLNMVCLTVAIVLSPTGTMTVNTPDLERALEMKEKQPHEAIEIFHSLVKREGTLG